MQPTLQFTSNFNMLQVLYPSCVVNSNRFESQHVSKHHFQVTLDLSFPPTSPLFFQSFSTVLLPSLQGFPDLGRFGYQQTHHPVLYETPPKTNIATEKPACLEYYFPFEMVPFQMTCSFFWGEGIVSSCFFNGNSNCIAYLCVHTRLLCVSPIHESYHNDPWCQGPPNQLHHSG